jgi:hypothetical protein
LEGTRKVKAISGTAAGKMAGKNAGVYGDYAGSDRAGEKCGFGDADGMEEVANWICAPGCPVASLDVQSGDRSSPWRGNLNVGKKGGAMFGGGVVNPPGLGKPEYRDAGGASRFFKQVQS